MFILEMIIILTIVGITCQYIENLITNSDESGNT